MKIRIPEYRADLKGLTEQRADLHTEMTAMLNKAKAETRSFTTDEVSKFNDIDAKIKAIDATIEAEERARALEGKAPTSTQPETRAEQEERAFVNYLRGTVEQRADVNLTVGANGAVIPTGIVNKIIKKVIDMCPIYSLATRYNVGGTLTVPYYDEETQAITMAYATEFTDLESTSGKFLNISLTGYLAGALTKVSKSLMNNSNFDLLNFIITAMGETIARFIEKELLVGTSGKVDGLSTITAGMTKTGASATAVTADELIDTQELIPDVYQGNCIWIMAKATRTAIRKLKDSDGNYLLNRDVSARWNYTLLGKDVYVSASMPAMATTKKSIFYGDFSGLAVKVTEDANIEVLREKYSTQHAVGVVAWIEIDAKIENAQKIACFKNA